MTFRNAASGVVGLLVALLITTPPLANAHATLTASDPIDGARLSRAPSMVRLHFDEPVTLIGDDTRVIDSSGTRVDNAKPGVGDGGSTITISIKPDVGVGSYAAMWRVRSADTHVVTGSIVFGVGQDAGARPRVAPAEPVWTARATEAASGVLYLGLILTVGIILISVYLWPFVLSRRLIRWIVAGGWVLLAAASFGQIVIRSGVDATMIARLLLLSVLGLVALARRVIGLRPWRYAFGLTATALVLSVALDGHASVGGQAWLAIIVTTAHLMAMSLWLGGLITLVVVVLAQHNPENARLQTWSVVAFTLVGVLILSGEFQAARQIGPIESLWTTTYGITLLVKIALVAAMLIAVWWARRVLVAPRLRWAVLVETALGVCVVAVTALLVNTAPARTSYGPSLTLTAPLDNGRAATVDVSTSRRGPVTYTIAPQHGVPQAVSGRLSSADAGVSALTVRFDGAGRQWRSTNAVVPLPGVWMLTLTVDYSTADAVVSTVTYRVF